MYNYCIIGWSKNKTQNTNTTHNDPLFLLRLRLTSSLTLQKENSGPAPPVILTWQYFGSSQERGAYNKHTNDNILGLNGALPVCQLVQQKVRYTYVFAKPMTVNCTFLE